jgi:hypothetical protein
MTESALRCCKRILRIGRLPLRGPRGAQFEFTGSHCPEPPQARKADRPAAAAGRPTCGVSVKSRCSRVEAQRSRFKAIASNGASSS